jgi:2'-5' RNA ligase
MSDTIRAFVAIQISEELGEALWELQDHLQRLPPLNGLRWVDPFDAHITLKFLINEVQVKELPAIIDALDNVAKEKSPFTIQLSEMGTFPNIHRPSVIWLGIEQGEKELKHLFDSVENGLRKIGIKRERRTFHPHLTLARVPKSWGQGQRRAVGNLIGPTRLPSLPKLQVNRIALMRSILTPEGPQYTRLAKSYF